MVEELADRVGDEAREGEPARCTGLRATGGGRLDEELVVEVDSRRSWADVRFDGGRAVLLDDDALCIDVWDNVLTKGSTPEGLYGGGSFRVPFVVLREVVGLIAATED